jgi:hypothetical protein
LKSISDFQIAIAIMIAIEKPIRIDRDPILIRKSIRDFYVKTGSRLKTVAWSVPLFVFSIAGLIMSR